MRTTHAVYWGSAVLALLVAAAPAGAQEFFSHSDLDYWGEVKAGRVPPPAKSSERSASPRRDDGDFRWSDYEDPTSVAFWDDGGNYTPPRPLRVAAADPTPENVAKYLRWQKRKMEVIGTLQAEVQRQTEADAPAPSAMPPALAAALPRGRETKTVVADQAKQDEILEESPTPIDWRRVDFIFFYSAECPHCQASVATARELERLGAKVIPVQVDWQKNAPLLPGSVHYTAEIAKEQPVEAVPTWVAAYEGDRFTMEGEVSVKSIEVTLQLAGKQKRALGAADTQ